MKTTQDTIKDVQEGKLKNIRLAHYGFDQSLLTLLKTGKTPDVV